MAAVRIVEEADVGPYGDPPNPAAPIQLPPAAPPAPDPSIVAALQSLNGRLQAVEGAIQGVPKALGLIGALTRALGNRALMLIALLGCMGLAGATALWPSTIGLAILGLFAVLVYLPMAYLASRGN